MTDERIIAYLLKELPEEELERFEDECFAQESWPLQLGMVEEDLIEAYLRGELTAGQRQNFEQKYLTTAARQERVAMAAALLKHVDEYPVAQVIVPTPPTAPSWTERFHAFWSGQSLALRSAFALALVAVVAGAAWLAFFREPSPQSFATLTLSISIGNNRAEGVQAARLKLPLKDDALRITLMLPEQAAPAARYRVELVNDKGDTRALDMAGRDAQSVSVVIPTAQLVRGQYALRLFAVNADGAERRINGSYFFDVE